MIGGGERVGMSDRGRSERVGMSDRGGVGG